MPSVRFQKLFFLSGISGLILFLISSLTRGGVIRRDALNGHISRSLSADNTLVKPLETGTSKTNNSQQMVLLLTHARSGSSVTSEMIKAHPGVFFFFEPLFPFNTMYRQLDKAGSMNKFHIWGDDKREASTEWMKSFLQCRPNNITAINNKLFRSRSNTSDMFRCLDTGDMTGWDHLTCYLDMVNKCQAQPISFVKSVRFRLRWADTLLQTMPNLKVLFLVRDPRAVLHSQSRVFHKAWFDWLDDQDINTVARWFCEELQDDILHFRAFKHRYSSRVKIIRYEDGAIDPLGYTKDIYKFLGLEVGGKITEYITRLTSSVKHHARREAGEREFETHRDNPTYAMQKWRYSAGYKSSSVVDNYCHILYPLLGYRKVISEVDLKGNNSLILEPETGGDLF